MTVNESKIKIMRIDNENEGDVSVSMDDAKMEIVDSYRYLGVRVSNDGRKENVAGSKRWNAWSYC